MFSTHYNYYHSVIIIFKTGGKRQFQVLHLLFSELLQLMQAFSSKPQVVKLRLMTSTNSGDGSL